LLFGKNSGFGGEIPLFVVIQTLDDRDFIGICCCMNIEQGRFFILSIINFFKKCYLFLKKVNNTNRKNIERNSN